MVYLILFIRVPMWDIWSVSILGLLRFCYGELLTHLCVDIFSACVSVWARQSLQMKTTDGSLLDGIRCATLDRYVCIYWIMVLKAFTYQQIEIFEISIAICVRQVAVTMAGPGHDCPQTCPVQGRVEGSRLPSLLCDSLCGTCTPLIPRQADLCTVPSFSMALA